MNLKRPKQALPTFDETALSQSKAVKAYLHSFVNHPAFPDVVAALRRRAVVQPGTLHLTQHAQLTAAGILQGYDLLIEDIINLSKESTEQVAESTQDYQQDPNLTEE